MLAPLQQGQLVSSGSGKGRLAARLARAKPPWGSITLKTIEEQTKAPFTPQKPESCKCEDLIPTPQRGNSEQAQLLAH